MADRLSHQINIEKKMKKTNFVFSPFAKRIESKRAPEFIIPRCPENTIFDFRLSPQVIQIAVK